MTPLRLWGEAAPPSPTGAPVTAQAGSSGTGHACKERGQKQRWYHGVQLPITCPVRPAGQGFTCLNHNRRKNLIPMSELLHHDPIYPATSCTSATAPPPWPAMLARFKWSADRSHVPDGSTDELTLKIRFQEGRRLTPGYVDRMLPSGSVGLLDVSYDHFIPHHHQ